MTSRMLAERLEQWALGLMATLEAQAVHGQRSLRCGAAGPLRVRHTFSRHSSHAQLLDSLTGAPPTDAAEVTIHSLQLNSDGVTPPPLPWSESDFDIQGRPLGLEDSSWRLAWNRGNCEVRCYHRQLRVGLFITAGPVKPWERGAPLRMFWHWAAAALGAAMVHGGTIGSPGAMGIVAGPGGTGKSTTVLLGMRDGLSSCGDDYVWLQPGAKGMDVWAVFRTIKTVAGSALAPPIRERVGEDSEVRKQIHWLPQDVLLPRAPLRVAWVLRPPSAEQRPLSHFDALSAVLPSTLLQVNGDAAVVSAVLRSALEAIEVRSLIRNGDYGALVQTLIRDCEQLMIPV
jgi:hypothetical protein